MSHVIRTLADLEAVYPEAPVPRSLTKELPYINKEYRQLIEASPFCVLATAGLDGLDASPRGDAPGFVVVADDRTLLMPDRRGNNRIDSLRNIVSDPRVALLFLIPGHGETLRVNGRATISTAPDVLERSSVEGRRPRSVLVISVEAVYFQCSRAIVRAGLWEFETWPAPGSVPSAGQVLAGIDAAFDGVGYDRDLPERVKASLY